MPVLRPCLSGLCGSRRSPEILGSKIPSRWGFWAFAVAFGVTLPAEAFTWNRNEAHLRWRSAETEHFKFNYPVELEAPAEYIAGIAETVAQDKLDRYRLKMPNKSEFIVRQDIFSNGWANSLQNTMTVWLTDWDFPIRSTHHWLRDVVTHEFSHLVSIQSGAKLPNFWQGLILGYDDYYNAPTQGHFATILPFMNYPNWLAEGVAQYESARSGFDAWDSHRDMLLRVAVREGKLLSLARMGSFAGNSLEYELGPYTQGFALTRFIGEKYGDESVIKIWSEMSRIHRQTASAALERVIGKDGDQVYAEWKESLSQRYEAQVRALGTPVTGKKLTSEGFYHYYPRFTRDGKQLFLLSNQGRDDFRASLMLYDLSDSAMKKKEAERMKAVAGIRSFYAVAGDDSTVIYHSAKDEDKNGIHHFDVYSRNARRKPPANPFAEDKTKKRFTKFLDAADPTFSADGKWAAFIRSDLGNFRLCLAPVPDGKELEADEVKTLWPSDAERERLAHGPYGFNIYTPRFSPDGKSIAFSYYDGASRNIGVVGRDGKNFKALLSRPYDERDPEWSPDGKALYFSADSGNIYNVYRLSLVAPSAADSAETAASTPVKANSPEALTRVVGGAFAPAISPDGKRLAYVGYDKDGFSIYLLDSLKALDSRQAEYQVRHKDSLVIESQALAGKSHPYRPLPNRPILTPLLLGQATSATNRLARSGELKWLAGLSGMANDPLLKNEVFGALLLQLGEGLDYIGSYSELLNPDKESQLYLSWRNHSLPVTLGAAYSRGNLTTTDTLEILDPPDKPELDVEKRLQHYALTYRDVNVTLGYDLFDATAVGDDEKTSFLQFTGGYNWNSFNFYEAEDGSSSGGSFQLDYYQSFYLNSLIWVYGADYNDKGLVAPSGLAGYFSHTLSNSGLLRNGTFQESFIINDNGVIEPRLRRYVLQDFDVGGTYGGELPWSKNSSLVLSAFAGALGWDFTNRSNEADTLDDFFSKGLYLRGYPYLRDIEHLAFSGQNTLKFSADLNQPLLPDIYAGAWIFFLEDLYFSAFWEAGRAWSGSFAETDLFRKQSWTLNGGTETWYQSVGWGLKLNARIYHNYPFLVYFEAATALSGVPNGQGKYKGTDKLETITWPFFGGHNNRIDTHATRIEFGVAFGLYNGLLGDGAGGAAKSGRRPTGARNPWNPASFFAGM